ncbi:LysR substrate-binding domain-containing protein [Pendulispora brunnea]|uniref:LysR substrate-binding domain-containing protein n=1 Tax=Pendulispora brunnea TaxID=2905690 RepID=A0ABZ2KA88_9BACT
MRRSTGRPAKLHVDGAFFSNDIDLLCDAAVRGLGIALLPRMLVRPHLESGALVQVRAFIDAAVAWVSRELAAGQRPSPRELPGVVAKKTKKAAPRSRRKRS